MSAGSRGLPGQTKCKLRSCHGWPHRCSAVWTSQTLELPWHSTLLWLSKLMAICILVIRMHFLMPRFWRSWPGGKWGPQGYVSFLNTNGWRFSEFLRRVLHVLVLWLWEFPNMQFLSSTHKNIAWKWKHLLVSLGWEDGLMSRMDECHCWLFQCVGIVVPLSHDMFWNLYFKASCMAWSWRWFVSCLVVSDLCKSQIYFQIGVNVHVHSTSFKWRQCTSFLALWLSQCAISSVLTV